MARRFSAPYQSEPVSSLATWSRNLAVFSIVAVVVSILIVRFGFLEMKPALATFFGALACAVLSILVGLAAFAAIWQNGSRGMVAAIITRSSIGQELFGQEHSGKNVSGKNNMRFTRFQLNFRPTAWP